LWRIITIKIYCVNLRSKTTVVLLLLSIDYQLVFIVNRKFLFFAAMSLFITSLNSGSNGNCYYIGNSSEAVLIDVGISCRETEKRMKQLELDIKKVKAIFVSHEHGDHIKGVSTLANKYNIPVYITCLTAKHGPILIKHLAKEFVANQAVTIGNLLITAFNKRHDAADPHSFIVSNNEVTVGVFTDIGLVCDKLTHYFKQCHAAFLESNYDEAMLENGRYPLHLKNRIRNGHGHLSNKQALELFVQHRPGFMTHLLLSHLSKENNSPQLAEELFMQHANGVSVIIASRNEPTAVYTIAANGLQQKKVLPLLLKPQQLNLFA
jgi:phosphoribosyl 1,2-cyclic phosphodiesterase